MAKTYAKRPENVEAVQNTGANKAEIIAFCPLVYEDGGDLFLTGMRINAGDWVTKDFGGVFAWMSEEMFPKYYNVPGPPVQQE